MMRIRNFLLIVLQLSALLLLSQTADETVPTTGNKVIEFGITGFHLRGYDFGKDLAGARDKYCLAGSPGFVFLYGNAVNQVRVRALYNEVSSSGRLRGRSFAMWFDRYSSSLMHYYRQEAELRIGYVITSSGNRKAGAHLYLSGDVFYAYGRHKYAVVYNDAGGFGEVIGYSYHCLGLLQTFGLKFPLRANFTLTAETGFAIESIFGKKNYYDPGISYYNANSTVGANIRLLQLSFTKKL